jgi:hypothetical protein
VKLKIFFDVLNETRGILLKDGCLPSFSFSESDNLAESLEKLYRQYISCDSFFPLTRPVVYQIEGEINICYRIVLTVFPKWIRDGSVCDLTEILKRGASDEINFVIQAFR